MPVGPMKEARYRYAQSLYDREFEIKERLEKKAAAAFSLPTALIGAAFLDPEAVAHARGLLDGAPMDGLGWLSLALLSASFASVMATLVLAVSAIVVQDYRKEYPRKLYEFLLKPGARHLQDVDHFHEEMAGRLALATEHNAEVNETKAGRLRWSVLSLLTSVVLLLLILASGLLTGGSP